ncbi:MAG TPA: hypothetical protein VM529_08375 [Gemmata sp.]|nr:hypothetical protein [Gemmata sp.]
MDELIQKVTEKAGINAEQAKNAVNSVIEFLKAKMPGIGDQISAMLSGGGGGGIIDSVKSKLGL